MTKKQIIPISLILGLGLLIVGCGSAENDVGSTGSQQTTAAVSTCSSSNGSIYTGADGSTICKTVKYADLVPYGTFPVLSSSDPLGYQALTLTSSGQPLTVRAGDRVTFASFSGGWGAQDVDTYHGIIFTWTVNSGCSISHSITSSSGLWATEGTTTFRPFSPSTKVMEHDGTLKIGFNANPQNVGCAYLSMTGQTKVEHCEKAGVTITCPF